MQVVLHSTYFHIFIIILVVLDALIVLCELLLDVGAFGKCMEGREGRGREGGERKGGGRNRKDSNKVWQLGQGQRDGTGTESLTLKTQHCCGFHGNTCDWQTTVY